MMESKNKYLSTFQSIAMVTVMVSLRIPGVSTFPRAFGLIEISEANLPPHQKGFENVIAANRVDTM